MLLTLIGLLGTTTIASIGWAINIGQSVKVIDQRHADIIELINTKFDGVEFRLERIEKSMNGSLLKH